MDARESGRKSGSNPARSEALIAAARNDWLLDLIPPASPQ
jgi:hypothetical protein